jgi:hypothetical protein
MFFTKDMQMWGALFWLLYLIPGAPPAGFDLYGFQILYGAFLLGFLFFIFHPNSSVFGRFEKKWPRFSSYFRAFGWISYIYWSLCTVIILIETASLFQLLPSFIPDDFLSSNYFLIFSFLKGVTWIFVILFWVWTGLKNGRHIVSQGNPNTFFKTRVVLLLFLFLLPVGRAVTSYQQRAVFQEKMLSEPLSERVMENEE